MESADRGRTKRKQKRSDARHLARQPETVTEAVCRRHSERGDFWQCRRSSGILRPLTSTNTGPATQPRA